MNTTLHDIVPQSARRFGDKVAIMIKPGFRTRAWTYRDLADVVPRGARYFAAAGIRKGDRVLIWGVNRPEYGIAFLAALRAGAVLVPIDVNSLPDFAQRIADRTEAVAAIVSAQTRERAAALGLPLHSMEGLPDAARTLEPLDPIDVGPDDLAEVVFTSGTTGDPKGAMLTSEGLTLRGRPLLLYRAARGALGVAALPLSHIMGFLSALAALLAGIPIHHLSRFDAERVLEVIDARRATVFIGVPAMYRMMADAGLDRFDLEQG
jgi:acyl-CoA synthetase (AMP-forming)/AMP-acid ligase II